MHLYSQNTKTHGECSTASTYINIIKEPGQIGASQKSYIICDFHSDLARAPYEIWSSLLFSVTNCTRFCMAFTSYKMCHGSLFINNKLPQSWYIAYERLGAGVIGGPAKNKDKEAGHQLCFFFLNSRMGFTFEQGTDQGDYRKFKSNKQVTIYSLLYCGTDTGKKI